MVGSTLIYLTSVDSTNRFARDLSDARAGTVVITDYQEAGRGRMGRTWTAPADSSLLLSVVFCDAGASAPLLMATPALAVCDAITAATSVECTLKWPNDVLIQRRKVAGILGETFLQDAERRSVIGMGVNCNVASKDLPLGATPATSLLIETGEEVNREELAVALLRQLELWYRCVTRDPDTAFAAWTARLDTIGSPVLVTEPSESWTGIATGVKRDGALLVRNEKGATCQVYAADVSVSKLTPS